MKKILTILAMAGAAAAVLASCSKNEPPVFNDANAFIAFESLSTSVSEQEDTIDIPVSLASVAGLEGAVTFKIEADTVTSGNSKIWPEEGKNYKILTEGGTLKFDSENRIQYIRVAGIYDDRYTGDLSIRIILDSKTTALGYNKECKVVINDVDHPLTAILGAYNAVTTNEGGTSTSSAWTMTIYKDDSDDHKVWIDNIFANSGWAITTTRVYGNVSEEGGVLTKINVPYQQVQYTYGSIPVFLLMYDKASGDWMEGGSADIAINNAGENVTLDFGDNGFMLYIQDLGYGAKVYPHITATKK